MNLHIFPHRPCNTNRGSQDILILCELCYFLTQIHKASGLYKQITKHTLEESTATNLTLKKVGGGGTEPHHISALVVLLTKTKSA